MRSLCGPIGSNRRFSLSADASPEINFPGSVCQTLIGCNGFTVHHGARHSIETLAGLSAVTAVGELREETRAGDGHLRGRLLYVRHGPLQRAVVRDRFGYQVIQSRIVVLPPPAGGQPVGGVNLPVDVPEVLRNRHNRSFIIGTDRAGGKKQRGRHGRRQNQESSFHCFPPSLLSSLASAFCDCSLACSSFSAILLSLRLSAR